MCYLNQVKQYKHRTKFVNEKILFILRDNERQPTEESF